MIKRIHVNQHTIKSNRVNGEDAPVLSVITYKGTEHAHELVIDGPCRIVYSPDKPLSCGARVWIETHAEVERIVRA